MLESIFHYRWDFRERGYIYYRIRALIDFFNFLDCCHFVIFQLLRSACRFCFPGSETNDHLCQFLSDFQQYFFTDILCGISDSSDLIDINADFVYLLDELRNLFCNNDPLILGQRDQIVGYALVSEFRLFFNFFFSVGVNLMCIFSVLRSVIN